jgi:hypothetical protein
MADILKSRTYYGSYEVYTVQRPYKTCVEILFMILRTA